MEYVRYTENLRQQLIRSGYKYVQWGTRLSPEAIGIERTAEDVTYLELLLHREKVANRRTVYEIDGEKAKMETSMPQVQFYVRQPY